MLNFFPKLFWQSEAKFDIPLCLDSPNPKAIEAALKVAGGKCLINSVNGEEKSLNALLPYCQGIWRCNYWIDNG